MNNLIPIVSYRVKNGIVINWLIMTPKNRASSQSKVVKISCNIENNTNILYSYIRGYTKNKSILSEYSLVLIIRNGNSDINLVYNSVISGNLDCETVQNSSTNSSLFCIKNRYYKVNLNNNLDCNCFSCLLQLNNPLK